MEKKEFQRKKCIRQSNIKFDEFSTYKSVIFQRNLTLLPTIINYPYSDHPYKERLVLFTIRKKNEQMAKKEIGQTYFFIIMDGI